MSDNFLTSGFRSAFHIPSVKRGPTRKRVTALQVRARQLGQTSEVTAILAELEKAARLVFDKVGVNSDDARRTAVTEAEKICDDLKTRLELAEQSDKQGGATNKATFATKAKQANDSPLTKELLDLVKAQEARVEALEKPQAPRQRVLAPSDAWSVTGLRGRLNGVRLMVQAQVIDQPRETVLRDEITTVTRIVTAALQDAAELQDYARGLQAGDGVLARARTAVDSLRRANTPGLDELPITGLLEQLTRLVSPAAALERSGLKALVRQLEAALQKLKDQPKAMLDEARLREERRKVQLPAFDKHVTKPLDDLRLVAVPLGLPSSVTLEGEVAQARADLLDISKPGQDGNALGQQLKGRIETALAAANQEGERRRQALRQLRTDLDKKVATVQATRKLDVFKADWGVIDAALEAIKALVPDTAPPLAEIVGVLAAAQPLVEQVNARVEAIAGRDPSSDNFDTRIAALKKQVKDAKAFKKYDLKGWTKIDADRTTLAKTVKTLPAATALAQLAKLDKDFTDKNDVAVAVDTLVQSAEGDIRNWFLAYALATSGVAGAVAPPEPNAIGIAMDAYTAAVNAQPAVLANVQKAIDDLRTACKDVNKKGVAAAAAETHGALKAKADQDAADLKNRRAGLDKLRYGLSRQAAEARQLIEAAKGDKAEIERVEDLLKTAKEQIDADQADAATRTMKVVANRIAMIQRNPAGEPTRRRKELQTLYNEWIRTCERAKKNLEAVIAGIQEHATSKTVQADKDKVTRLATAVGVWRDRFTAAMPALAQALEQLADPATPDGGARDAREKALAIVQDALRQLQAHPLTAELARASFPAARLVPGSLVRALDRLNFTVQISVG